MYTPFDDNDNTEKQAERIREFYEEYSAEVRRQLLVKNLIQPSSVYDILYPQTREDMLAKNENLTTSLDEYSQDIRNNLLSKIIKTETDLNAVSENVRKSLLSKNKIVDITKDLFYISEEARQMLLAKNKPQEPGALENTALAQRNNALSKNKTIGQKDLEVTSESYRLDSLSKNMPTEINLDDIGSAARENNVSKNSSIDSELERVSERIREDALSKNVINTQDLAEYSQEFVQNNLSKNASLGFDLEEASKLTRDEMVAKNSSTQSNLEDAALLARDNNMSKNKPGEQTIDSSADSLRKQQISKNNVEQQDILIDSEEFRNNNISKNIESVSDLEADSEVFRADLQSKNKPSVNNLEEISQVFLADNLSKNTPGQLVDNSDEYRQALLSANIPSLIDLQTFSLPFYQDLIALNIPAGINIDTYDDPARADMLSNNTPTGINIDTYDDPARADMLSDNAPTGINIDTYDDSARDDMLSDNVPTGLNIDTYDDDARADMLSENIPTGLNIDTYDDDARADMLSENVPTGLNIDTYDDDARADMLSENVPTGLSIDTYDDTARADLLSLNIPNPTGPETNADNYRNLLLSQNVPIGIDIDTYDDIARADLLAQNVPSGVNIDTYDDNARADLLAQNVPSGVNIDTYDDNARADLLAQNVPSGNDLLIDSAPFLDSNISANIPSSGDLLGDSQQFLEDNISKNPVNTQFGINIQGFGTSAFIGVSRLLIQSIPIRTLLQSMNVPSPVSLDQQGIISQFLISKNKYQIGDNEYGFGSPGSNTQVASGFFTTNPGLNPGIQSESVNSQKALFELGKYNEYTSKPLQGKYGTTLVPTTRAANIGDSHAFVAYQVSYNRGSITDAARNLNAASSYYNTLGLQRGAQDGWNTITNNNDTGFQQLLSLSLPNGLVNPGSYGAPITNPNIAGPLYLGVQSVEDILKPNLSTGSGATNLSDGYNYAAKTVAGNPLDRDEFKNGTRGLKMVMNRIKGSQSIDFAQNFDPQNQREYIIGKDGTELRKSKQRYTIANQYKPEGAAKLIFTIKNYASGDQLYFPPYIQTFSNSDSASYNAITFLGRPEPVYTYNNSSREGSITFFVLTDFAQQVDIGVNWDSFTSIKFNADGKRFTSTEQLINRDTRGILDSQAALIVDSLTNLGQTQQFASDNAGAPDGATIQANLEDLTNETNNLITSYQRVLSDTIGINPGYSEAATKNGNVYNNITETLTSTNNEYRIRVRDTIARLDDMKSALMFQPAYFSGDKADFLYKMEFLAKLTRPATNSAQVGFSFTRPPICHLRLGTWFDHDVVINNVSTDYADAPWTLDLSSTGEVQPMWASVTLNFNIIGPYGGGGGVPYLSDDTGGAWSPKR